VVLTGPDYEGTVAKPPKMQLQEFDDSSGFGGS